MAQFKRLGCAAVMAVILVPQNAMAQITADDVWQNIQDYAGVFSGDVTATTARSGDTLSISDMTMKFVLPRNAGNVTVSFAPAQLSEQSDGTVTITYPVPASYEFVADITGKGIYSGSLNFVFDAPSYTASGSPGDITYTYAYDQITMKLDDVAFDGAEEFSVSAALGMTGISGTTRIAVGEFVTTTSRLSVGNQIFSARFQDGNGGVVTIDDKAESAIQTGTMVLPREGVDIMNLAAALREGLSLNMSYEVTGSDSRQVTEADGIVVSSDITLAQSQKADLGLDQSGLRMNGTATDMEVSLMPSPDIPFPIEFQAKNTSFSMSTPLSAATELQDVEFVLSMDRVTLAEQLWAIFDPNQSLPRDPMTLSLNMSAEVKNLLDWLDIASVMALEGSGEFPVELHTANLNVLGLDMFGARLIASGAATFDNSDLVTYGGFPKPAGTLDLSLIGANGLLDTLVSMGLISDEDATGARMMTGIFTQPDPENGEDALKSRLEMTEDGQILANGQRLR